MKRSIRRTGAAVSTVAIAMATIVACAPSGGSDSSGGQTLTYWATNQGTSLANDKEVLTPVLDAFTKKTGIKVDLEVIGWNDVQTRIQTAITSGKGPDVLNIGNTSAPTMQATGAFMPFDDAAFDAIGGKDKFVATALATGGAPGKAPISVPLYGYAYGLYYNKQMFADAGITPPTTWEQLVDDAQKLTSPDHGVWGLALPAANYVENAHFAFITSSQNGAAVFNGAGKPTFTQDGTVDGILRYLDLMQRDKVVSPADAQFDSGSQAVNAFATKKAAMVINQNNADSSIQSNGMSADEYGVVPLPAPEGGKQISSFPAGINLAVFGKSDKKHAALQFVSYMTSKEAQATLDKPFSALPVLKGVDASFTTNADEAKTFLEIYNTRSKPLPLVPSEYDFEATVGKAMNDLFATIATGGTVSRSDVANALKTAEDQVAAAGQ